jgi:hypothetical protein
MTKLYEGYGKMPDKIDEATRRVAWSLGGLESGEERILSYVVYSKLQTVGRLELGAAKLVYEKDGKTDAVNSNKTFFVSEAGSGEY